ncbi:MAG: hypothetical protein J1F32_01135 [Erysipelotrichales bacterium]|nr:hypothetical protein [Erysipelotrichales bacterium]
MKKRTILFALLLALTGCTTSPSVSSNNSLGPDSVNQENSSPSVSIDSVTSTSPSQTPSSQSQQSSSSNVSNSTSTSSSPEELKLSTIKEIRTLGKKLNANEVGQLVKFKATYLRAITMSRSNEDLMYFADSESYIYLRVAYANYSGYLANRYTNQEYIVTANVAKVDGVIELAFNKEIGSQETVVNCGQNVQTSVNLEKISEKKESILSMVDDFDNIPLNKKKYGTGKIVTFTGQLIATDREDANKKAVFSDGTGVISVIANGQKFINAEDVGKYYEITGILNVEVTSPAILHLSSKYVEMSDDLENSIDAEQAKTVEPDFLKSKYVLGDDFKSPSVKEYMTLYKTTGYVVQNSKHTTNYYLGIAKENKGSLISDSSSGNNKSVSGLFLMNHYNINERSFSYSVFYDYYYSDTEVELYFTIHQFYSQDHGWKIFPIEALVEPLSE